MIDREFFKELCRELCGEVGSFYLGSGSGNYFNMTILGCLHFEFVRNFYSEGGFRFCFYFEQGFSPVVDDLGSLELVGDCNVVVDVGHPDLVGDCKEFVRRYVDYWRERGLG